MRSRFQRTLDTVLENDTVSPQIDGATRTYHGPTPGVNNGFGTPAQWQEFEAMRQKVKADKLGAMNVDQKIDLALKQSENAERTAYKTAAAISSIDNKLDRALDGMTQMISRVSHGKPAKEPDPPGSSILGDDEDDESIIPGY